MWTKLDFSGQKLSKDAKMEDTTCQRKRHNGTLKLAKFWTVGSPSRQKEETGLNFANFGR